MAAHKQDLQQSIHDVVRFALQEDIGSGDVSAALCGDGTRLAEVICRETATLCGQAWFEETFKQLDDSMHVEWLRKDGETMHPGNTVCTVRGAARTILSGERTALNFLQTLSGTATQAKKLLHRLKGTHTILLDTRKTLPGLRLAQKYAVTCAGAQNHRMGLYDAYLIKENHIAACGSIENAIQRARQQNPTLNIEVEVETLSQLQQAIEHQAHRALLDNFTIKQVEQAVEIAQGRIKLEVSGNINMNNISQYALLGVDYISVGAITKHVQAVDFSMLLNPEN